MVKYLKTMKHLLAVVLCCLSEKQGLCSSSGEPKRFLNISNFDLLASRLSNKVFLVGKKFFDENLLVSMYFPLIEDNLMFELMVKTNQKMNSIWTVLTNDSVLPKSKCDVINPIAVWNRPDVYIVPLHQPEEFDRFKAQLQQIKRHASFNPRAVFVFLKLTNQCGQYNKPNIWVSYFSELWKHDCLSAVVLVLSKCDFQLTTLTAKPFSSKNPCRSLSAQGISFHTFSPEIEDIIFPKESPKHFNGCSFEVATAPYPPFTIAKLTQKPKNKTVLNYVGGLEIELIRLLSTKLGFSYEFDHRYDNVKSACLIDDVNCTGFEIEPDKIQHKIEFRFGGITPNYKSIFKYDISFIYMFSELSWYVTNAVVIPQWEVILYVYTLHIWFLLALMILTFSFMYNKLEEYELNSSKLGTVKYYLELFRIFLGFSSTLKPQGSHSRVLYFAWTLFSLHMTTAFSTCLFELLRNPPTKKDIRTIQDLSISGLNIAGPNMYFLMFEDFNIDNNTKKAVLSMRIHCIDLETCFEQLFRYRNFSIMDRFEHIRYLVDLKRMKIHKIDENVITLGVSILINRGSPLTMHINKITMHAFEAGLIKQWERETSWRYSYQLNTEIPTEETSSPLRAKDLQTAFFLLFFGYVASFSVLVIEISYTYLNKILLKRSVNLSV